MIDVFEHGPVRELRLARPPVNALNPALLEALRAALAQLGPKARVAVAELVPAVIDWARGPLADLFAGSLTDPRVTLHEADVGDLIAPARSRYDAILLDVQMPLMDGPPAARHIRERERQTGRRRTPIIALTANAMTHQVADYLAAGMDGFVAKPIEVSRLFEALEAALNPAEPEGRAAS